MIKITYNVTSLPRSPLRWQHGKLDGNIKLYVTQWYGTMGGKTKDQGQKLQNDFNSGSENN
jgi:hypothetical protein